MSDRIFLDLEGVKRAVLVLRNQSASLVDSLSGTDKTALSTSSTVSGFRGVGLRLGRVSAV